MSNEEVPPAVPAEQWPGDAWRALLPPLLTSTVLLLAYFLLPFTGVIAGRALVALVIGGLLVCVTLGWELRRVLHAENPLARGLEGLAAVFGLHLVGFATVYSILSEVDPANFSEALTRLDALYFCVTVFATVGFGDIVADSQPARAAVLVQMIGNLVLIGAALRLFTHAVDRRRRQLDRREPSDPSG
ncbi:MULTISPECIES: potassium channel family protein [unclassified Nocardia]|uniref:potassium channel family protein n=1 Tax=unclassified Nocardia TaxID=2637762 RepID=UPI0024A94E1B|nr:MULTISPECIES: potassium channel family protein [unclassified Nocardia]